MPLWTPTENPHARRWMMFVDGENLTIRAQELAAKRGVSLTPGLNYEQNVFVWMPGVTPNRFAPTGPVISGPLEGYAIRCYYYTSVVGDEVRLNTVRTSLWELGFHPEVFKRDKGSQRSKGVDITLTKDVLSHAYQGNFDVALLVAGDGDYVPLVREVKRLGKNVDGMFFDGPGLGLNQELRLAVDTFHHLDDHFVEKWKAVP